MFIHFPELCLLGFSMAIPKGIPDLDPRSIRALKAKLAAALGIEEGLGDDWIILDQEAGWNGVEGQKLFCLFCNTG
jgi:hypothetical protein